MPNLSISSLINVSVNLAPIPAQAQTLTNILVMSNSPVIDVVERVRTYTDLAGVATDFGTTGVEYLSAALWFEQVPQPTAFNVGRFADSDTAGRLVGGSLSATQQAITNFNAITAGTLDIAVNGVLLNLIGLNFSLATNLNAVAAALTAAAVGITFTWDSAYSRFIAESATTGATSSVSFVSGGTTLNLFGLAATEGGYEVVGIAAETPLAAATLMDVDYGQNFYAITFPTLDPVADLASHIAVAQYIEGSVNKHVYGISTQEAGVLSTVGTSIADEMAALNLKRTITQYSSSNAYSVHSLLARALTVDYNGNNTVITLMYKQEPGIVAESLNANQMAALVSKNCNVFVAYNNNTAIIEPGVVASGEFLDVITGTDWLALDLQTAMYNLLYTANTKIPQTDAGNHILMTGMEAIMDQSVANGLVAPGTWGANGFGSLQQGDFLPKGYYIYAPPIALQNPADRAARKSVTFQIAAKLAGAIHTVDIQINVNR